jgi:transcription initiation factor TFIIIB Brf1 subunit/transcription initiation factor TFIIB
MPPTKCEFCRNKDVSYFVHDQQTDSCICTICGCVQRGVYTMDNSNFDKSEPVAKVHSSGEKISANMFSQLMVRAFPKEERARKREIKITSICCSLDLPSVVKERAIKMFNEFTEELSKIRPIEHTLVACVVVSARSNQRLFLPMSSVYRQFHEIENISDLSKRVCKVVGINQRVIIINSVPYVTSMLKLPFRCEKIIRDNYDTIGSLVPSMCGETKLAVAVCKTLKDHGKEIDIAYIAVLTDSTEASIKGFMNKRRKGVDQGSQPTKRIKKIL